jgi:hypothetical protein
MNSILRSLGDRMLTRVAPEVTARAAACCGNGNAGLCSNQCRTDGLWVMCRLTALPETCGAWKLCKPGMIC